MWVGTSPECNFRLIGWRRLLCCSRQIHRRCDVSRLAARHRPTAAYKARLSRGFLYNPWIRRRSDTACRPRRVTGVIITIYNAILSTFPAPVTRGTIYRFCRQQTLRCFVGFPIIGATSLFPVHVVSTYTRQEDTCRFVTSLWRQTMERGVARLVVVIVIVIVDVMTSTASLTPEVRNKRRILFVRYTAVHIWLCLTEWRSIM